MGNIQQIVSWCGGTWLHHYADSIIKELVTDSRKVYQPEYALFIAIQTPQRNGHNYLQSAYKKGVRNFLVHQSVDAGQLPESNIILVQDTLQALQQIAAGHRKQYTIPVVGITGSNGKTIVKEWLYQLLSPAYNTIRSPKSYNSQIGVPLSVWLMEPQHEIGIFEAGISKSNEMNKLAPIIQPTIGIFTNIGDAHNEGFTDKMQKVNEKLQLFRDVQQLIYCCDDPLLQECIEAFALQVNNTSANHPSQLFTWSMHHDADLRITQVQQHNKTTQLQGIYKGVQQQISIPFTDPASIENAIHCWCTLLILGLPHQYIAEHMAALQSVAMRLELRQGVNNCSIINDSYNSDLTSLLIALDYLDQQKQHLHKTVILSDMLQMGRPEQELYEEVASLLQRRNIDRFIGIGPAIYAHRNLFQQNNIFYTSTEEFIEQLHQLTFDDEAILLKGARVFEFEKIGILLEQKVHQTVLSINLSALKHNLDFFRSQLQPGVKTMVMVKAFSYGSGSYEIAHLLQFSGVDYLAVAYTDEGIELRKGGITMPIMVMSPDAVSFDRMIAWNLEPEIFNKRSLLSFIEIAKALQVKHYPIHIKLDTGMHRLGFMTDEIDEVLPYLVNNPHITIASIFSHLAASEDPSLDTFTQLQADNFKKACNKLLPLLPTRPLLHLSNSAGIERHPDLNFDMVRLGIGIYGVSSTAQSKLRPVGTLKTTIAQIKDVPAGETVGYGRKGISQQPLRIATICIGYADGYPRALGNGVAHVLIHNKPAKLVGVVCMDMCMVDITHIPEAAEGDEVILFSPELPIAQVSAWAGTIPYEFMTGISQRVKRVYVNE
jgi:alanine racemase